MNTSRLLIPVVGAICALAISGTANEPGSSCIVDVGAALTLTNETKTTDVIPLVEGSWVDGVYVLPYAYPETYDRHLAGGIDNIQARQWAAQSFFAHNPDAYDFIAVITGFPFDAGWGQFGDPAHALYWGVRNDTSGIGLDYFDHSQAFGSHRLQGYIDANSLELVRDSEGNLDETHLLTVLSHELGHRWLAYCDFQDHQGATSSALRGVDDGHWSYLLDSDASYMYGADWFDNDNGSFTATEVKARYSELDLYLMGMLEAHEVGAFDLLVNPAVPADQYPELGATITATPTAVTAVDVVAAEGPRIPSAEEAPHELRIALVYLVAPGVQVSTEELDFLAAARQTWQRRFFAQTDGRGVIGVGRNSLPPVNPSSLDLAAAVAWLVGAADGSGLWQDSPTTRGRDSAAAITALDIYGGHSPAVAMALDALGSISTAATEVEAWRAEPLARHAHPGAAALLDRLSTWVLDEGAWGGGLRYAGDTATTARVARSLAAGGRSTEAEQALAWLFDRQNTDGGWSWRGAGPSAVGPTLEVIGSALAVDPQHWNHSSIQNALTWLLARRSQGGFGEPHPDVIQTSLFLTAAHGRAPSQELIDDAIAFLAARQRSDGSWGASVFQTALAVAALAPYVQPDLAVSPSELHVEPESPFIEDPLTLRAAVHSLNADLPAGASYRWEVIDASQNIVATLDGVLPSIPATLFATVTDSWDLRYRVSPGAYTFRFTADSLHEIAEADESNNTAELPVTFVEHTGWIDLVLSPDTLQATPGVIGSVPQTVVIDGVIENTGWAEARDAVIAVMEEGSSTPLASTTAYVPRNGEAAFQLSVEFAEARPHHLVVVADPDDLLNDVDPSNNRAELFLGVAQNFDPAVVADSLSVTPASGLEAGDLVVIAFDVINLGTQALSGLQIGISATLGDPPNTTPLQLMEINDGLGPGETRTMTFEWRPPNADPQLALAVEVDPSQLVDDVDRSNNTAEIVFAVAPSPLPNLVADHNAVVFDPEPALQHETVHISATVANPTDNPAGAFTARLWIDEIGTGVLVAETVVAGLAAGGTTMVDADWLVDEMADRLVWIEVDGDGEVPEFNEDDNADFRVLDVSTIPDLVVTSGQVNVDPRLPRTGELVHMEVGVLNTGDQPATDVEVELGVADGAVIETATIALIEGGGIETVAFDWPTDGIVGDTTLRISADSTDTVEELDEDNNVVDLVVTVQDADLWVTERVFSPNGDGIKDTTTIYVRNGVSTLEVIDPWGEVVRTLDVDASGRAVWDGRKTGGAAVRDGVYDLVADGLRSWVEIDLNATTITDDIRQPLITGLVPRTSTHWAAEFTSYAPSPVDGIVYLTEKLSYAYGDFKMWRWNGERLEDVVDWPLGYWTIHQMSAQEDLFITGSISYSLVRFPGPVIDPLPSPLSAADTPYLSPDGEWILWVDQRYLQAERWVVLQRTTDLGETYEFGPFSSGSASAWTHEPTIHWGPDGSTAVVTSNNLPFYSNGTGIALVIDLGTTPSIRETALDQGCGRVNLNGNERQVAASVDFEHGELICTRDWSQSLFIIDLQTGSTKTSIDLPALPGFDPDWYRLSNDGRVVDVNKIYPELKSAALGLPSPVRYDWQRGLVGPMFTSNWSPRDRYNWSRIGAFFEYFTPAANLAVTLNPVVRFGGSGIDLFLTVTDKNLDYYKLEYSPASDPDNFEALGQPARGIIFGENWGTWIPPAQGTWRIRLTAVDLAGNERSVTRWVTWNGVSDIAGLWPETHHISPVASPGVQDQLVWHYTVLRPAQLLFEITDDLGSLIRSIPVGAAQPGPTTTTWDGRDDAGQPVPDGGYRLTFRGAEWPVVVDNTPPAVSFEIFDNGLRPTADEIDTAGDMVPPIEFTRSALFNQASWSVSDDNLELAIFETRHVDQTQWAPASAIPLFASVTTPESRAAEVRSEWWSDRLTRQVATDRAGNRSVAERLHREEQLAVAFAEPPCRSEDEPCLFPDRPDINALRDADGLMNDSVAVLWPDYSTILVQSTLWGDWLSTLRLEFRTPGDNGLPAGDWQPGALTAADQMVWRTPQVLTGNWVQPTATLRAMALPVYWEHEGLPLRLYEVRLVAENRDGVEFATPITQVVPKAPLAVEYLSTDAAGDHFRVHNISTERIDGIVLEGSLDALTWLPAADIGALEPGLSVQVTTGCGFLDAAINGTMTNWIRVVGLDPWSAPQASLPTSFQRAGPPVAVSRPSFSMVRGDCATDSTPAMGMMGYNTDPPILVECTSWSCELGWYSPGRLVDLQIQVPATDPNGAAVTGYELLIDGNVVAGSPDLEPGATGRVVLDLQGLAEGDHLVSERYLFAPGEQGMLSSCVRSAGLHIDRTAAMSITSPTEGQALCPDQGLVPIIAGVGEETWSETFLIDGGDTGITVDPATREPAISVPALTPGIHVLEASMVDLAGNAACASVEFSSQGVAAVVGLEIDPPVFSPINTMGRPTATLISFGSTADAEWAAEIRDSYDDPVQAATGTIAAGATVSLGWDGRVFGEDMADDGIYGLWIRLVSDCGAIYETPDPLPEITVDTEGPAVVVINPGSGALLGTAIELQALITDPHFEHWEARLSRPPPIPGDPTVIASGDRVSTDPENVLVRWPVSNLVAGDYVLVVEATDRAGNQTLTEEIQIEVRSFDLIASFEAEPIYFSPNGDGNADTVDFAFELLGEAEIILEYEGWIELIVSEVFSPGTLHITPWDGSDPDQNPVPDGAYSFTFTAYDTGSGAWEADNATVIIDRSPPIVVVSSPQDGAITALPVTISGFTEDVHADGHGVVLLHPDGVTTELTSGSGNWSPDEEFTFDDLTDGIYQVTVTATDLALNSTTVEHEFALDNTAPSAQITSPGAGAGLDPALQPIVLRGLIGAAHPQSYSWWIAEGASPLPGDFVLVHGADLTTAGSVEYLWTGPPPADGAHTIRLSALDQLGRAAEDRHLITIDGEAPVVELWSPTDGALITEPVAISGLIDDANLSHWTLEEIGSDGIERLLAAGSVPAENELIVWDPLPADGAVTLRLSAFDHAGHSSRASVAVEVSVLPPGAPIDLTADVVNGRDVELSWQPGSGPAPVGYHVERNGIRITTLPVAPPALTDFQLLDAVYTYRVVAVGPLGRESDPSDPASVVVNLTPPAVAITSPANGRRIGSEVAIYGTAFAADDFAFWELSARAAAAPDWLVLDAATAPVVGGFMTNWITHLAPWSDGPHELRLAAEDTFGNRAERVISVIIDNSPPDPGPVNLQAQLVALDGDGVVNDIRLSWAQAPSPPDLAGFYLYRNGLLANAGGPIIGDPSPYLLSATDYDDKDVSDGSYTYTVAAADTAGNVSALSNEAGPITVDLRRPHAVIVEPADGTEFEGDIEIVVECADDDVVSLDLEYKLGSQPDWTPMAPSFTGPPYVALFNPPSNDVWSVRALASDAFGPDPAPHIIQITAADLPPAAPSQLTARVAGDHVTLTWISPPDPADDLAGYDIERDGLVINATLIPADVVAYVDADLTDGIYEYRVVSVDDASQRRATNPVTASVLTPFWLWTPPVTTAGSATLTGGRAHPSAQVEIEIFVPGAGLRTAAIVESDANGVFEIKNLGLEPGANSLTAFSTDDEGNTSRVSLPLLVVSHPPPEPPENLTAVPNGDDVTLSWTTPPDPESAGFTIVRAGTAINETVSALVFDPVSHALSASGGDVTGLGLVVDGNPATGWAPTRVPTLGTPEWWSWTWPDPVEIDEVSIGWSASDPPQVFDIDVLTGGGWLWVATLSWNGEPATLVPVGVTASGVRIRIPMTGFCGNASCLPELTEVGVTSLERTTGNTYFDENLPEGAHSYELTHLNIWGQSSWSAGVAVAVGPDQPLPPTNLTAAPLDCGGIELQWQPTAGQPGPLSGHRIYRSDQAAGPFSMIGNTGAVQNTWTDSTAPVGEERHYFVTSRVVIEGVVVESQPSTPAWGTASCLNPPPPVITHPTVAGQPIQITPSQTPVRVKGTTIWGSVVTLLHNGEPVETKTSSSLFSFYDVEVRPGLNTYVVQQELHGTVTDSAPIEIELDPSLVSDLVAISLTVAPSAAAPDDLVMVEGTITLLSMAGSDEAFDAVIELEDTTGMTAEIYRTRLNLVAGEQRTIRTGWTASGAAGRYTWRLLVDPHDEVLEVDEDNNRADAPFLLLDGAGVDLTVKTDRSVYLVGQQLTGDVFFANTGPPEDFHLESRLEDASGRLIAVLDSRLLTDFTGDWLDLTIDYPLVGLYPGIYRIRAAASVNGVDVAEGLTPFVLEQAVFVEAGVATDRSSYPEGSPVSVTGWVHNLGTSILEGLVATLSVIDENTGLPVGPSMVTDIAIAAGATAEVGWGWSSAGAQLGAHRATLVVTDNRGTILATAAPFPFTVVPGDLRLAATINLSGSPVEPGDGVTAEVAIENTGDTDLTNLEIALKLIDPVELHLIEQHLHTASIAAGAEHVFAQPLDTSDLILQRYVVLVTVTGNDGRAPFDLDLGSATLEIADLSPPTVQVLEPAGGGVACEAINIIANVHDALSRVDRVYHTLDDETAAVPLHLVDPSGDPNLYSATRPLPPGLDGTHEITVFADDAAGNLSNGETVLFDADTAAPVLQVAGPANGSCNAADVVFTFTAFDAHLALLTAVVDGQPYTSGSAISTEGDHVFEVTAADACGRQENQTRTFIIDSTDPEVVVEGVSHGADVTLGTVLQWSVSDSHLVSGGATLDGAVIGPSVTLDIPGPHTLHITADDCAGNTADVTVQFTVSESILALSGAATASPALLEPGESLTIGGTVANGGADLGAVQLVLDVVQSSTAAMVATHAETINFGAGQTHGTTAIVDTSGWELDVYEIRLAARGEFLGQPFDLALATSTATLADLTAPQIMVTSPVAGLACQSIEVAAEVTDALSGVAGVTVVVNGGAPLPLAHTGGATWSAALILDEGAHDLEVAATDGAGNPTAPITIGIDLDTEAPVMTITAPEDGSCSGEPAAMEFTAEDAHLDEVTATLDGSPIVSGFLVEEDGSYELSITAIDECGRSTTDERIFVIDTIDPEIGITGIEDGEVHVVDVAGEVSVTDDNLVSSSATLDGIPIDPSFTVSTVGPHLLEVTADDCAGNTAERSMTFEIVRAEDGLSGTVAAEPQQVEPPLDLDVTATITNLIDTPYSGLGLRLEIVDPSTGLAVDSFETTADLAAGANLDLAHAFATGGLPPGQYVLAFSAAGTVHGNAFEIELANQNFEVIDQTAPVVTLISPDPGLACEPLEVRVTATDAVSGVDAVWAHVDGGPESLPLVQTAGGFWTIDLSLDEDVHQIAVVAEDVAGNRSDTSAVEVDLDLTPPVLAVEAPVDGACLFGPATISFSAEDRHLEELTALLDGDTIGSGSVVSSDGAHHLMVSAVDACGRTDSHTGDFTIDTIPPVITVTGVADGGDYSPSVEIVWVIDDDHLVGVDATLDGDPVASEIVVNTLGGHVLVIEALDCAGNRERIEISFTITDDPLSGLEAVPPSMTAGGSVLVLDRSLAGGEALEGWLSDHAGRVTRVTDACTFLDELRRSHHELVVLYAPTGAVPLDTPSCAGEPEIIDLAAELSAVAYRRGGILVLGEGMEGDGCLGCLLGASGTTFHNHVIDRVEVGATTAIVTMGDDLTLFDLRPLDPAGSFPLLLGDSGDAPICDGMTSVRLEIDAGFIGPWIIEVQSDTPHEALDTEIGELLDGESLDASAHPWVDLAISRADGALVIDVRSTSGGALPEWLALTVTIDEAGGAPGRALEASVWIPTDCELAVGQTFDLLAVAAVTALAHDADQTVAATARRYGRGEALVLPWDALAPANQEALPAVAEALLFSMPTEPWPASTGLPLPVTFGVRNDGSATAMIRIDAAVPLTLLLEAWGDPLTLDPVGWEFELGAGEAANRTVWLLPNTTTTHMEIPYSIRASHGDGWTTIENDVVEIEVHPSNRRTALRDLRTALVECAESTDDPAVLEVLRDVLAAGERVAVTGTDRSAADEAIRDLSRAFVAAEDDQLPCVADLRGRLAELIALWQAQWAANGSAR
jgi:subtilase family serine protease